MDLPDRLTGSDAKKPVGTFSTLIVLDPMVSIGVTSSDYSDLYAPLVKLRTSFFHELRKTH